MTPSVSAEQQVSSAELWDTAMHWVSANKKLIRQIAAPYRRHMAVENTDLLQEAAIAAFKALLATRKKAEPEQFAPFFRVIFKTSCIKLASGIQADHDLEMHRIPCPERQENKTGEEDGKALEEALKTVSKRQREICVWLLEQPEPVSTPELAREFKITRRHACRLVSNSIKRLTGTES